jgi:hypothetical protein
MVDVTTIITTTLSIIGGATVLLRTIAPMTKTLADDNILKFLERLLELVSLDTKAVEGEFLKIKIKEK